MDLSKHHFLLVFICLAYVELAWDPLSRHQSVCLSDVCHRLKEDYSVFEGERSKPVKVKPTQTYILHIWHNSRSQFNTDILLLYDLLKQTLELFFIPVTRSDSSSSRFRLVIKLKLLCIAGDWIEGSHILRIEAALYSSGKKVYFMTLSSSLIDGTEATRINISESSLVVFSFYK